MSTDDVTGDAIRVYDRIASQFDAHVRSSAHNAFYERPAMLALLPDVEGLRVLDAGCGSGAYAEILVSLGAQVVALDASAEMVALTRDKLGNTVPVHQHDLRDPADFLEPGYFDVVLCPLVLDHVPSLDPVFHEFHRVLRPEGLLVFSMVHPLNDYPKRGTNYFRVEAIFPLMSAFGVELPSYRRPLSDIHRALRAAGFMLEELIEPTPTEDCENAHPEDYEKLCTQPVFICLRAVRCAAASHRV